MNRDFINSVIFYWNCVGAINVIFLIAILCCVGMVLIPHESGS